MRLLVYGGRDFADQGKLWHRLDGIVEMVRLVAGQQLTIIQGEARGADRLAKVWAMHSRALGVEWESYPAIWDDLITPPVKIKYRNLISMTGAYNALAGFARNQRMIDQGHPTHALECPGEKGTKDMHDRLVKAGITPMLL